MELDGVTYAIGDRTLFEELSFHRYVGNAGRAWSGRTAAARPRCSACCAATFKPHGGEIRKANALRIVYFDQNRATRSRPHAAPRARAGQRFGHLSGPRDPRRRVGGAIPVCERATLNQPVGRLSGGERARVLIAQLMLQPADVLLLDEPTNDLDIPTLEILEESLLEYRGRAGAGDARSLHAGSRLDRGPRPRWTGRSRTFRRLLAMGRLAAIPEIQRRAQLIATKPARTRIGRQTQPPPPRKKLSYGENRELAQPLSSASPRRRRNCSPSTPH